MASLVNKKMSIAIISPLYKLTTWLAITPQFNFNTGASDGGGKLYGFLMICALFSAFFYSCYGRFTETYKEEKYATHIFLSLSSYVILTISNISSCLNVRLKNQQKTIDLLQGFMEVDKKLDKSIPSSISIKFYAELVLYYGLLFLHCVYDEMYQALVYKKTFNLYLFLRKPQTFFNFCLALLIHNFGLQFKYRFEILNHMLERHREIPSINVVGMRRLDESKNNFHNINSCYIKLTELVNVFNDIFGWQIAYLSADFVMGLLYSINKAIVEMNDTPVVNISVHFWLNCLFYSICTMTLCIPFASSCNGAAEESKNTSILCYALLSSMSMHDKDLSKREELNSLASVNSPTFSAAGFFDVDHTMLFTLFGSVTSYLIVLLQLKDMRL